MSIGSHHILDEEFEIVKANHREFAIHYTTYRENIFFRQSWEKKVPIEASQFTYMEFYHAETGR